MNLLENRKFDFLLYLQDFKEIFIIYSTFKKKCISVVKFVNYLLFFLIFLFIGMIFFY